MYLKTDKMLWPQILIINNKDEFLMFGSVRRSKNANADVCFMSIRPSAPSHLSV